MLFSEALRWCVEHDASWNFEFDARAGAYVLVVACYDEEVAVRSASATDWGWMLIDAVEQLEVILSASRPTFPEFAPCLGRVEQGRPCHSSYVGGVPPG